MAVLIYLAAITAANLIVAQLGPSAVIWVAFLFIGLDLTLRDSLHERWTGRQLWPRMAVLIAAGGLLSYALNRDAGQIALASCVAFVAASAADAGVYTALHRRPWAQRVNGSNVVAAAVDSLLFPTLAFGAFLPLVVLGQFAAKVLGGAFWTAVLVAVEYRRESLHDGAPMGLADYALYLRASAVGGLRTGGTEAWELEYQSAPDPEADL
jgi:hypothetical protein